MEKCIAITVVLFFKPYFYNIRFIKSKHRYYFCLFNIFPRDYVILSIFKLTKLKINKTGEIQSDFRIEVFKLNDLLQTNTGYF